MKKELIPYLFLTISIIAVTLIWEKISIPGSDITKIYYLYPNLSHNIYTDLIRFLFFVFFPIIIYLLIFFKISKNLFSFREVLFDKGFSTKKISKKENTTIFLGLILAYVILDFLSINFLELYTEVDHLHDGVFLSPSYNFGLTGGLWKNSFAEYGFLNFDSIVIWEIFNFKSIGLAKFFKNFYLLMNKILILLMIFEVSKTLNLKSVNSNIFFIFVSIFSVGLIDYKEGDASEIPSRLLFLLCFLYVLILILGNEKIHKIKSLFLGFFSTLSIFWSIDMGIYIYVLITLILIYFVIVKNYKKFLFISLGVLIGTVFIFSVLNFQEISSFKENISIMLKNNDRVNGLIFPTPFLSGNERATKFLIGYLLSAILLINVIFRKKYNVSINFKIFF